MPETPPQPPQLIDDRRYSGEPGPPRRWGDIVFRFCTFEGFELNGDVFGGVMAHSTVRQLLFYWGSFNVATFVGVRFEDCTFRGQSFRGCAFVGCSFASCRFLPGNLGGPCTFEDCTLTECTFERRRLERGADTDRHHVTDMRSYGCTQTDCEGLDDLFANVDRAALRGGHKRKRG